MMTALLILVLVVSTAIPGYAFRPSHGLDAGAAFGRRPASIRWVRLSGSVVLERYAIPSPPAYRRPPPGFRPLSGSRPASIPVRPVAPGANRGWIPGRTEVVIGLDDRGRLVHVRQYIPGHFERVADGDWRFR